MKIPLTVVFELQYRVKKDANDYQICRVSFLLPFSKQTARSVSQHSHANGVACKLLTQKLINV